MIPFISANQVYLNIDSFEADICVTTSDLTDTACNTTEYISLPATGDPVILITPRPAYVKSSEDAVTWISFIDNFFHPMMLALPYIIPVLFLLFLIGLVFMSIYQGK